MLFKKLKYSTGSNTEKSHCNLHISLIRQNDTSLSMDCGHFILVQKLSPTDICL